MDRRIFLQNRAEPYQKTGWQAQATRTTAVPAYGLSRFQKNCRLLVTGRATVFCPLLKAPSQTRLQV